MGKSARQPSGYGSSRFCLGSRAAIALAALALSGCESIQQADGDIGRITAVTEAKSNQLRQIQRGNVIKEARPYYGEANARPVQKVGHGQRLPAKLQRRNGVKLRLAQPSRIEAIASGIQDVSGLPVRIRRRYPGEDGLVNEVPINGSMTIDHDGPLSALLDQVSSRFDVAWRYDGRSIRLDRMQTVSYPVSLPLQDGSFSTSIGAALSGTGGARNASFTSSSEQRPWDELIGLLTSVAPAPSRIVESRDTGRLTLIAPPSVQAVAKEIIDDFDKSYSARIGLEIALFFVDATKTDDYALGLDFNLAFDEASFQITGAAGASLAGPAVGSASILSPVALAGTNIDLRALSQSRAVVDSQFFSAVTQSGVVAPFVRARTQNFVSSISSSINDSASQTGIETDTIDTGVFIHALPRLIDDGRIHLTTSILQSNLVALDSFTSGDGTVQLPQTDERVTQKSIILAPGETLILSGYEQESAERRDDGTGKSDFFGLGGARFGNTTRTRLIILVRPSLIPASGGSYQVASNG